jgi:membrane-bound metal-dependent hydrolase YbcI (DUF457 family)
MRNRTTARKAREPTRVGPLLWWITGNPTSVTAIFVAYGSHLLADMMTIGGVQIFWPSRTIAVFLRRNDYRIVAGSGSEGAFVAVEWFWR